MAEPWGLADRSKFSEKDHLSLQYGNKILKATIKILYLLLELRIPAIMENPRSSRMWHIPQIKRLLDSALTTFVICDLCQS